MLFSKGDKLGYTSIFIIFKIKAKNLFKYIDTQRSGEIADPIMSHFGISRWTELIGKYGEKSTLQLNILENELLSSVEKKLTGEYNYWDFSLATGTLSWYGGVNCTSIGVSSGDGFRALVGNMSIAHGDEYGSLVYEFPYTENIRIGDYLSFDVRISDTVGAGYELKLTLGGDGYSAESKTIIISNSDITKVYFDTSLLEGFGNISYIKLSARPLSGSSAEYSLALSDVSMHSLHYTSEELEDAVLESRRALREAQIDESNRSILSAKYIIAIVAVVLLMTVITFMVARKKIFFDK